MVAWTLFHNCFAVHVFMTKFSSLFRKMPTALLGATRQKLYSKGVLEWSEINEYRIPAVPNGLLSIYAVTADSDVRPWCSCE